MPYLNKAFKGVRLVSFMSLILGMIFVGACNQDDPTRKGDQQNLTDFDNDKRLLVINSISEDFSLINLKEPNPQVIKNKAMHNKNNQDKTPCIAPSKVKKFGDELFVICSLSQEIHIFSLKTLNLKKIIYLGEGVNPMDLVFKDQSLAYVSSWLKDEILIINPSSKNVSKRIYGSISLKNLQLSSDPGQITRPAPAGMQLVNNFLFVSLNNLNSSLQAGGPGYMVMINTDSNSIQELIQTQGRNALNFSHTPESEMSDFLFIVHAGDYRSGSGFIGNGSVDWYDIKANKIVHTTALNGAPFSMHLDHEISQAFLTNGMESHLLQIDLKTKNESTPLSLRGQACSRKSPSPFSFISSLVIDEKFIIATEFNSNCLLIINKQTGHLEQFFSVGDGPQEVLFW